MLHLQLLLLQLHRIRARTRPAPVRRRLLERLRREHLLLVRRRLLRHQHLVRLLLLRRGRACPAPRDHLQLRRVELLALLPAVRLGGEAHVRRHHLRAAARPVRDGAPECVGPAGDAACTATAAVRGELRPVGCVGGVREVRAAGLLRGGWLVLVGGELLLLLKLLLLLERVRIRHGVLLLLLLLVLMALLLEVLLLLLVHLLLVLLHCLHLLHVHLLLQRCRPPARLRLHLHPGGHPDPELCLLLHLRRRLYPRGCRRSHRPPAATNAHQSHARRSMPHRPTGRRRRLGHRKWRTSPCAACAAPTVYTLARTGSGASGAHAAAGVTPAPRPRPALARALGSRARATASPRATASASAMAAPWAWGPAAWRVRQPCSDWRALCAAPEAVARTAGSAAGTSLWPAPCRAGASGEARAPAGAAAAVVAVVTAVGAAAVVVVEQAVVVAEQAVAPRVALSPLHSAGHLSAARTGQIAAPGTELVSQDIPAPPPLLGVGGAAEQQTPDARAWATA